MKVNDDGTIWLASIVWDYLEDKGWYTPATFLKGRHLRQSSYLVTLKTQLSALVGLGLAVESVSISGRGVAYAWKFGINPVLLEGKMYRGVQAAISGFGVVNDLKTGERVWAGMNPTAWAIAHAGQYAEGLDVVETDCETD